MTGLDFTAEARRDLVDLLRRSRRDFGESAQARYRWLIQRAAYDLRMPRIAPASERSGTTCSPIT